MNELAKVLDLESDELEIYRDYQESGFPDGDRLRLAVKEEARQRAMGREPITGAMLRAHVEGQA